MEPVILGLNWTNRLNIWVASGLTSGGFRYGEALGQNQAYIFGLTVERPTGKHFGWARAQGTNGVSLANFNTNRPPVFSEITINPVPYAAIQLGRPSPGGPVLSYRRQSTNQLRFTYPDWGTRYAIRCRSRPKGPVVKVYAGGRGGLVATNGVYTVDVPIDQAEGYFELFLPSQNLGE